MIRNARTSTYGLFKQEGMRVALFKVFISTSETVQNDCRVSVRSKYAPPGNNDDNNKKYDNNSNNYNNNHNKTDDNNIKDNNNNNSNKLLMI